MDFLIVSIVLLIVMLMIFSITFYNLREKFYNVSLRPEMNAELGTEFSDPFKGTPVIEITALETRRFPFVVENVKNWYSTQPLVPSILGTDTGKQCPNGIC